jgi:hypothetical protein
MPSGSWYILQRMTPFHVFAVILFIAVGTLDWKQGCVYLIQTLLGDIATLVVLATRAPETLAERGIQHAGVKGFDRGFAASWVALTLVTQLVAGLGTRLAGSSIPSAVLYVGAF